MGTQGGAPHSASRLFFGAAMEARGDGYAHYPLAQWRNGQWADPMLAHAGTEAVRLVPFSSLLLSETLTLSSDYRSLAWRLPLCQDAVRIRQWRQQVWRSEHAGHRPSRHRVVPRRGCVERGSHERAALGTACDECHEHVVREPRRAGLEPLRHWLTLCSTLPQGSAPHCFARATRLL